MSEADDGVLVDAAAELLKAAILLRDMLSAMPIKMMVGIPPDILNRMTDYRYQSAFDALPADIRERATAQALADPDVQEARRIDAGRKP
jgi:hypothetical protein